MNETHIQGTLNKFPVCGFSCIMTTEMRTVRPFRPAVNHRKCGSPKSAPAAERNREPSGRVSAARILSPAARADQSQTPAAAQANRSANASGRASQSQRKRQRPAQANRNANASRHASQPQRAQTQRQQFADIFTGGRN